MHYLKKIVHKTTNENAAQTAKKSKNPTRILRRVRSYKIIISRKDFVKSFNVTIFYKNLALPYKKNRALNQGSQRKPFVLDSTISVPRVETGHECVCS